MNFIQNITTYLSENPEAMSKFLGFELSISTTQPSLFNATSSYYNENLPSSTLRINHLRRRTGHSIKPKTLPFARKKSEFFINLSKLFSILNFGSFEVGILCI